MKITFCNARVGFRIPHYPIQQSSLACYLENSTSRGWWLGSLMRTLMDRVRRKGAVRNAWAIEHRFNWILHLWLAERFLFQILRRRKSILAEVSSFHGKNLLFYYSVKFQKIRTCRSRVFGNWLMIFTLSWNQDWQKCTISTTTSCLTCCVSNTRVTTISLYWSVLSLESVLWSLTIRWNLNWEREPERSNGIGMERGAFLFTGATPLLRLQRTRRVAKSLTSGLRTPNQMPSLPRVP